MYQAINIALHLVDMAVLGVLVANMLQSVLQRDLVAAYAGEETDELQSEEPP